MRSLRSRKGTPSSSGPAQATVDPIPVARAKGIYFWTPEGKRFIDFNSQLMCVNIGHGDPRVIDAIQKQAAAMPYVDAVDDDRAARAPGCETRGDRTPATSMCSFLPMAGPRRTKTRSRSHALYTGRQKILSRFIAPITALQPGLWPPPGEPRAGGKHRCPGLFMCSVHIMAWPAETDTADEALPLSRGSDSNSKGRSRLPAIIMEPVTGTNGILIPPDGYLSGASGPLRQVPHPPDCGRNHDRLRGYRQVVCGRSLEHRARHHDDGEGNHERVRSAWRGRASKGRLPRSSRRHRFQVGLTYSSHSLACAAALATIAGRRAGRPHRQGPADREGDGGAPCRSPARATLPSERSARSVSSALSSSCAAEILWSRWRRSTAPRPRWPRSATSSGKRGSSHLSAGIISSPILLCASRKPSCSMRSPSSTADWRLPTER